MDCFDLIVVGSGPGATFAAYGARGRGVLMLDAGRDAHAGREWRGNVYEWRRTSADLFTALIGDRFESLHNLAHPPISLKLKAPDMAYITRESRRATPILGDAFEGAIALAKGGLANAWGAGVYRFGARDLAGFPVGESDLRPYFDELTAHIGISGTNDDLEPYFGRDDRLQPPLRLSTLFAGLLAQYAQKKRFFREARVAVGRPRLAVLTAPHRGRTPYEYSNLEFFRPHDPAIYTPAYTVNEMIAAGSVDYRGGRVVTRFRETGDGVDVVARDAATGAEATYRGRQLLLGAGALNTARIVLQSHDDYETRLAVLDNSMACLPFFRLSRVGDPLATRDTSLAQLTLVAEDDEWNEPLQASIYAATGPLRSDFLPSLPLSIRANLTWIKYLAPAMGLVMLFYPGRASAASGVRLRRSGELEVQFGTEPEHRVERRLIGLLRKMGYVAHPGFTRRPGGGAGLHYAGTLPMRATPGPYETHPDGLLAGTKRVYVVDGASFPRLPSKNLTLAIMANALRIGRARAAEQA